MRLLGWRDSNLGRGDHGGSAYYILVMLRNVNAQDVLAFLHRQGHLGRSIPLGVYLFIVYICLRFRHSPCIYCRKTISS